MWNAHGKMVSLRDRLACYLARQGQCSMIQAALSTYGGTQLGTQRMFIIAYHGKSFMGFRRFTKFTENLGT